MTKNFSDMGNKFMASVMSTDISNTQRNLFAQMLLTAQSRKLDLKSPFPSGAYALVDVYSRWLVIRNH